MKYKLTAIYFNRGEMYQPVTRGQIPGKPWPCFVIAIETQNTGTGKKYIQARAFYETRKFVQFIKIFAECVLAVRDLTTGKPRFGWEIQA